MSGPVRIVGLGPAGFDRVSSRVAAILGDPTVPVVGRTVHHPASAELDENRQVLWCDDLYEAGESFEDVYEAIAARVMDLAGKGPVVYAVPGSASVGETAVGLIRRACREAGIEVNVDAGESFLDLAFARLEMDPLVGGFQVLDAHDLPEQLMLHLPTFISQLDGAVAFAAVHEKLTRLLDGSTKVTVLRDLGLDGETIAEHELGTLRPEVCGLRVTLFLDVEPPGWPGLVATNARLRKECPWDKEQTHHSLARHLLEEAYEVLDAIQGLPVTAPAGPTDVPAYVHLEEELGDLLLQVVFHATLAAEAEVFDVEEVAESVRRKLVKRHPHVFGDVDAPTADHVLSNWEASKRREKERESLLDGVPRTLPALARAAEFQARAAAVGFDWPAVDGVVAKVREEIDELAAAGDDREAVAEEMGDVLFSLVNLARHLGVDPEASLRAAAEKFQRRFRLVEADGDPAAATLEELDRRWEAAKRGE